MTKKKDRPRPRKCTHCASEKTPQWRNGPLGPKTLCNACGVRYKSDRLVPEYRPAASPTFELTQHSNSHREVIQLRRQKQFSRLLPFGPANCIMKGSTEDKTVLCLCHWGRKNKVLPDGSISYEGGITDHIIVKTGIKYNDFVNAVFDRLGIDPLGKILHFTVKFDVSELIRLRDQEGVNSLLQFNDGSAHVYVSSLEKEPNSRLPSGGVERVELLTSEGVSDDRNDFESSQKKARSNQSTGVTKLCSNQNGSALPKGDVRNNSSKIGTVTVQARSGGEEEVELIDSEGVSDDENDFASSLKKPRSNHSAKDKSVKKARFNQSVGSDKKNAGVTKSCSNHVERSNQHELALPKGDVQNKSSKDRAVTLQARSGGAKRVELKSCEYPDPEFNDFEKYKAKDCLEADQMWAWYDDVDGMPRFYALISKIQFCPEFKLEARWLHPHPEDKNAVLHVVCGKFSRGTPTLKLNPDVFSHQVMYERDTQGLYSVYPRKGETWALFRDWDIRWRSINNHGKYEHEVVEILCDYVVDVGVRVGYLDKVAGFVSLFQRTRAAEAGTFFVHQKEVNKFSHRIPSFKMSGNEGEGVPAGSFELDPASLPPNPDGICYPGKVKEEEQD